jgi:hypothetical protein
MGRSSYLDPAAIRFCFPGWRFLLPSALARAREVHPIVQKIAQQPSADPSPARGFYRRRIVAPFMHQVFFLLEKTSPLVAASPFRIREKGGGPSRIRTSDTRIFNFHVAP